MSDTATTFTAADIREILRLMRDVPIYSHGDKLLQLDEVLEAYASRLEQDEHEARHGGPVSQWTVSHVLHSADPLCDRTDSHPLADCGIQVRRWSPNP